MASMTSPSTICGIDDLPLATAEGGGRARKDRVSEVILGIVDPERFSLPDESF